MSHKFMGIEMPNADYRLVPVGSDRKHFAAVDAGVYEQVRWKRWSLQRSGNGDGLYAQTNMARGTVQLHRFVWSLTHPYILDRPDLVVDHKNGCGLNCRLYNLREATYVQNGMNRAGAHNSVSGIRGIKWLDDRRCYRVRVAGEQIGYTRDLAEAIKMLEIAEEKAYGDFARSVSVDLTKTHIL